MSYPAARYHATLPCRLVRNEDEDATLGAGWRNRPFPPVPAPPPELTPIEALTAERDELRAQLEQVTRERDTLALELPRLTREMDALKAGMAKKGKTKPEAQPEPEPKE
jgi:hypothetical protein